MRKSGLVAAAAVSAMVLTACGSGDGGDEGDSASVSVVASFYPAQFVAERVGGDLIDVSTLTSPGAEPHDLELTAKQTGEVQDADVVIYLEHFQTAVDEAVEQADRDDATTVDMSADVELLEGSEDGHDHGHEDGEEGHGDERGDEHAHEDGHDHEHEGEEGEEGHDHGGVDPHLWLDPANLEPSATAMADALSEADPDNADTYKKNAEELVGELKTLDQEYEDGLAKCERQEFVTSHAAFAYLAEAYGLQQMPIAGIDPGSEPSSAQLAEIAKLVQDEGITTVFTETLISGDLAETIARETGAETATLDPIEGLSDDTEDEDYFSLMRTNLEALQKANGC